MLWLQIYVKLSEINGAAIFNNLSAMLSKPVDFVRSIFFRYFFYFFTGDLWNKKKCLQEFFHYKTSAAYQNSKSQ